MKFICWLCMAVLMAAMPPLQAIAAEAVTVKGAWVRATAPAQKTAGAYMELVSASDAALVAAQTPAAAKTELHSMRMDGDVMRMRAVDQIALAAGKTVKLAPGSLHLMLIDIRQPLQAGMKVPLELTFQSAGGARFMLKVEAEVRAATAATPHRHH